MHFSFEFLKRRGGEAVGQMTAPRWLGWRQAAERTDKPRWSLASILVRVLICILIVLVPVYFISFGGNRLWNWNTLDSSLDDDWSWKHTPGYTYGEHVSHAEFNRSQLCRGARGLPLQEGITEDLPRRTLELPGHDYTNNTYGSYEALGLKKTWMTFEQRYGPYGYNEGDVTYNFSRVDWSKIDWAVLQDECAAVQSNNPYSGNFILPDGKPQMHFRDDEPYPVKIEGKTGRQAIVVRTWTGYTYTDEDKWNLRSLITEAALATGAEYTVYLLVHVKGKKEDADIYNDPKRYQEILEAYVPREFQKMAVLFHRQLLVNWYPKVEQYTPFWQIMQPMQLFATFYPEYDHYWQIEMDTRFTGRVDDMLRSFSDFGKMQPYKQSRERASWTYMPEAHGSYEEFSAKIDQSLKGGAMVWGPTPKESVGKFVTPIGPEPPVPDAKDDNFEWRVGEDPHLLLLERVVDPALFEPGFIFRDWFRGFEKETPRLHSPNAQCRISRELLHQVHAAQVNYGVRLPGESTMPSFALWNGLQIVQVPMPKYLFRPRDTRELGYIHNGGKLNRLPHGIANAIDVYYRGSVNFYARPNTFNYKSSLSGSAFQRWMDGGHFGPSDSTFRSEAQKRPASQEGEIPDGLPEFMREFDGSVYMPNMMLHPRKTSAKYV